MNVLPRMMVVVRVLNKRGGSIGSRFVNNSLMAPKKMNPMPTTSSEIVSADPDNLSTMGCTRNSGQRHTPRCLARGKADEKKGDAGYDQKETEEIKSMNVLLKRSSLMGVKLRIEGRSIREADHSSLEITYLEET